MLGLRCVTLNHARVDVCLGDYFLRITADCGADGQVRRNSFFAVHVEFSYRKELCTAVSVSVVGNWNKTSDASSILARFGSARENFI